VTARVALVTGVSRRAGIGAAIARRLAAAGTDLLLQGWQPHDAGQAWGADEGGAEALAAELRATGRTVELIGADLADPAAPGRLVAAAYDRFGRLDILVANHAHSLDWAPFATATAEEIDLSHAVNTRASLLLAREFAARHKSGAGGRVILLTSGQDVTPMPEEIPYAASKAALSGVTRSLAAALAPAGITVNCIDPGPTDTGWATPELLERERARLPFGRWGEPDDAARLIAWLASEDGRWVTGQVIHSDGGHSLFA
jgi:3-oxoacyl-[acyl-carrier protein] reductase